MEEGKGALKDRGTPIWALVFPPVYRFLSQKHDIQEKHFWGPLYFVKKFETPVKHCINTDHPLVFLFYFSELFRWLDPYLFLLYHRFVVSFYVFFSFSFVFLQFIIIIMLKSIG